VTVLPAAGLPCGARLAQVAAELAPCRGSNSPRHPLGCAKGQPERACAPRRHPGARPHSASALFRLACGVRWGLACRGLSGLFVALDGLRRFLGGSPSWLGGEPSYLGGASSFGGGGPSGLLGKPSFWGGTPSFLLGAPGSELGECTSMGRGRVFELGACLR
jgi:hypothetical protein